MGLGQEGRTEVASKHEQAFEDLMEAISASAKRVENANLHENQRAAALRDLGAAYRHLRGGAQPGGVHVDGK